MHLYPYFIYYICNSHQFTNDIYYEYGKIRKPLYYDYLSIIGSFCSIFTILCKWIFKNKKICYALCLILSVLFILLSYLFAPHCYMMAYPYTGMSIDDIEYDSNCIVMLSSHFLLTCLTNKLSNTEHFYATTYNTALSDDYSANFDFKQ